MNKTYFASITKFIEKQKKYFPEKKFNHTSLTKSGKYGSASLIISQIKDSDFFIKTQGKLLSHGYTFRYSADTGKSFYAKFNYKPESSLFSATANVFTSNAKRTGEDETIISDNFASLQTNFKFEPFSISLAAGLQYDKSLSLASFLNVKNNQYLVNCVLSDKEINVNTSVMTKFGFFGDFSFNKRPFIINSLLAGYTKEYKQLHGIASFDVVSAKAELAGVFQGSDSVSFAAFCTCDLKQKQAVLKLGTLIKKDSKLRAIVDMRGNVEMDVVMKPKDWLSVTLSSYTNVIRAEMVSFGWSLNFDI